MNPRDFFPLSDPMFTHMRMIETTANPDGSSTSHVLVKCTLVDIARATGLRVEDAAFALNECGLLIRRVNTSQTTTTTVSDEGHENGNSNGIGNGTENGQRGQTPLQGERQGQEREGDRCVEETIAISREMVEAVARERNVKKMCMDLAHVML